MSSWALFSSKKPSTNLYSSYHQRVPSADNRHQQEVAQSLLLNVSTHSSTNEIVKTVSAVNALNSSPTRPASQKTNSQIVLKYKCICCGTHLKVPGGLPYFKCMLY